MRRIQRLAAAGVLATLTAAAGACGGEDAAASGDSGGARAAGGRVAEQTAEAGPSTTGEDGTDTAVTSRGVTTIDQIYGPACGRLPGEGEGSAWDMIDDPAGTAISNNPLLTTLTKALKRVGLFATLNNPEAEFTVFAPTDSAFEKLPPGTLEELNDAQLANILTYHIVPVRHDAKGLAADGEVDTLLGATLTITGKKGSLVIDRQQQARVLCGNIPTANATVFLIDTVLLPGTGLLPKAGSGDASASATASASADPQG